ncbi:MAG: hypothetical protein D3926_00700 [Desulfobacteraceae bacterium]|nr:MAG: hypothetical protein D3926_00700 [Desulfobacteraceae bacterium]
MKIKIDPRIYGLPPRTALFQQGSNEFTIEINRKSRVVMKDAAALLEKAIKIKHIEPGAAITLETSAPICSKSVKFLDESGIRVLKSEG